jgi:hypothetical protein
MFQSQLFNIALTTNYDSNNTRDDSQPIQNLWMFICPHALCIDVGILNEHREYIYKYMSYEHGGPLVRACK